MLDTNAISTLRSKTNAPMSACKSALQEANGDIEKAIDIIRIKGQNITSAQAGKVAAEGTIAISRKSNNCVVATELNCNTDFCSRSPKFQEFAQLAADTIAMVDPTQLPSNLDDLMSADKVMTLGEHRKVLMGETKENIVLRRHWISECFGANRIVASYNHNGKIVALLQMETSNEVLAKETAFRELGESICMQIASMNPIAVSRDQISAEEIDRQKAIFLEQVKEMKKPEASWPMIMDGKLKKWFGEVCLTEQEAVFSPKNTIQLLMDIMSKRASGAVGQIKLLSFLRLQLGEGLDTAQNAPNFAEEVASMSGVPTAENKGCREPVLQNIYPGNTLKN